MKQSFAKYCLPVFADSTAIRSFPSNLNSTPRQRHMRSRHYQLILQFPILILIVVSSLACTNPSAQAIIPIAPPRASEFKEGDDWVWFPELPDATPTIMPDQMLMLYPNWTRQYLCESNVHYVGNPLLGKTIRFQTPIAVNPNHAPRVLEALHHYKAMTGNLIDFRIVDSDPPIGIVFVEGDALDRNGEPGCGHVTSERDPHSGLVFSVTSEGIIDSRLYIHLGSARCDPTREGFQCCSIAEHELAHALGLGEHFPGHTGIEGISLELLVTLTALYRLPPGTPMSGVCGSLF